MTELKNAILRLETEQKEKKILLRMEFDTLIENLKPKHLIKNLLNGSEDHEDIKSSLINGSIGLASGIAAKNLLLGKTHNPFTRILGAFIERSVSNRVTKNAGGIISIAGALLKKLVNKKTT